jgi:hypothetical protein
MEEPMLIRSTLGSRIHTAIALILLAALLGCGGGGVEGTYVAKPEGSGEGGIKLELKDENRATVTLTAPDGEAMPSAEGTWSQEGNRITTVMGADRDVYTIEDGNLTIDAFGEQMVFEKQ